LTNAGGAPLGIGGISTNDDFAETNTCGNSLVPSASCAIKVAFTPGSTGTHVGLLTITDTAPGSPHSVPLTGKAAAGSAAGPAVALSSTGLSFGAQHVNVSSSPQTVSVTNNSPAVVAISTISVEGDFSEADTCGDSIAAGATCTVTVVFTPSAVGTRGGKITINDDAPNSPQAIALSGTGVLGQIALSPASLTFSSQSVDTTSDAHRVTITNNGGAPVTIVSVSATGDFAQTNTCTDPLAASGGSCTVSVTFAPTSAGTRTGTLSVVDDAPGSPHSIVLDGTGASR